MKASNLELKHKRPQVRLNHGLQYPPKLGGAKEGGDAASSPQVVNGRVGVMTRSHEFANGPFLREISSNLRHKFVRVESTPGVYSKLVSTNHGLQSSWLESVIG